MFGVQQGENEMSRRIFALIILAVAIIFLIFNYDNYGLAFLLVGWLEITGIEILTEIKSLKEDIKKLKKES